MKKLFIVLCCAAIVSCKKETKANPATSPAQNEATPATQNDTATTTEATPIDESDPIAAIRTKVERINTTELKKKHFEFMCDEKMKVDYFYEGNEIVKITVDFGTVGDTYAREDYYYDNGNLIFNYEFVEGGPACEGCIKTNEYRSYISNNKTIKYLKDKTTQPCKKCEFGKSARQYKLLTAGTENEVKAILCPL
ncbi:hypothetical protein AMR72_05845 [Flavobacterium psychrophilum]|nr:hypothetical protein AMR72_05845 [Flavobacterium psychrophilum]AOE52083.1 hypothetical protein ALW18_05840 [Flavobacterium psychrophilum]